LYLIRGGNESNGATRVYYTLTDEGRAYLEEDKLEYKYLRTLLDNLLTDEDFDLDKEQVPFQAARSETTYQACENRSGRRRK
jgi:DNA-binding PadR family transcriptional regulator